MTKKDLTEYCTTNNIRKERVEAIKASGIVRADAIVKVLEKEQEIVRNIQHLTDIADSMKNAYFFHAPNVASLRRSYEDRYTVEEIEWFDGKDRFTAEFRVNCSCKNIYAKGYYERNGKCTNLKAIKCSLERLRKNLYCE